MVRFENIKEDIYTYDNEKLGKAFKAICKQVENGDNFLNMKECTLNILANIYNNSLLALKEVENEG